MSFDPLAHGPDWKPAFESVESLVGGRIIACERQNRWRPVFFVEVERPDGEILPICFRSGRLEFKDGSAIRHEYNCFKALESGGILVPKIYGFCESPPGIVMQTSPGRHDLATAKNAEELVSVRDHFIDILAEIHRLPTDNFEAFGLRKLTSARDLALGESKSSIKRFRAAQTRPDPGLEFLIDWTERNIPEHRSECCFVTGDSGQFIFEDGRVTAMLDMELGYLGDPLADLGGLFARDLTEKMGDIESAIARYEKVTGKPADRRTILYHAIRFSMTTPLATALIIADPPVSAEFVQYLTWYLVYLRSALELIAHFEGIEIEPPPIAKAETISPYSVAHDALQARFGAFKTKDDFQAYEADGLRRLALYLREADRFGPSLLQADLDDAEPLLGHRPQSWQDRDAALSELVRESDGTRN